MAEYIDKDTAIQICMDSWDAGDASQDIKDEPPAEVIELKPILDGYEKLVQTNPTSKQVDEYCVKTMRKILCDYYVERMVPEDNKIEEPSRPDSDSHEEFER